MDIGWPISQAPLTQTVMATAPFLTYQLDLVNIEWVKPLEGLRCVSMTVWLHTRTILMN